MSATPQTSASKRRLLLAAPGLVLAMEPVLVWAQQAKAVEAMQSQLPQYQPQALKLLANDPQAIELDIPPLADSGHSIPFSLTLRAPGSLQIRSFEIIAPENPLPVVLRVVLPVPTNRFQLSTRIRLALSQDVWVIALFDNGQKLANSVPSVVTLNACFDAT